MSDTFLNWEGLSWEQFEEICLYFAGCVFQNRRFEKFGRNGEKQDGIDILSKDELGEGQICIQSKRYKKMDSTALKTAILEFEINDFAKTSKSFVIATKASLNDRKVLDLIRSEKKRINKKYKIIFSTWDVSYLKRN